MDDRHKDILEHFRQRPRWSNLPYVLRRDRNTLGKLFLDSGLNKGVEIGVRKGDFSAVLCKANPNIELYCVDPWERYGGWSQEHLDEYCEHTKKQLEPYNATVLRMKSLDAIHEFDKKPLDFAYIDGDHRFDHCMQDIIEWSRRVKRGGIIAVHDYGNIPGDVGQAVNAYTHGHHVDPWYMTREIEATAFWVKP
jgi:predicted O-methyltransferase YrrM